MRADVRSCMLAACLLSAATTAYCQTGSTVTTTVAPKGKQTKAKGKQTTQPVPTPTPAPTAAPESTGAPAPTAAPAPAAGDMQPAAPDAAGQQSVTSTVQPGGKVVETPAASEDEKAPDAKADLPAAHSTRDLPPEVEANPPKPEDLKASGSTWKGEYEADKDGKAILGPDDLPIPVLYNSKGKREKSKIKKAKSHPIHIASGTLTVDGWTGKAHLNYDIPDLKFIFLSAPTVGTVVVSQAAFPGSKEQKEAFVGKTLTVKAGDHELQLASDTVLLGKKPESAWVRQDADFTEDPRYPVMGYGSAAKAPYEWPGAKDTKQKGVSDAPPLPMSMRPKMIDTTCVAKPGAPCPAVKKPVPAAAPASPK